MKKIQRRFLLLVVLGISSVAYPMNRAKQEKQEELQLLRKTFVLVYGKEGQDGKSLPESPLRAFFKNLDSRVKAHFDDQAFYKHDDMERNNQALLTVLKRYLSVVEEPHDEYESVIPGSQPLDIPLTGK